MKLYLYDLRGNFYYCNGEFAAYEGAKSVYRLRLRRESPNDTRPPRAAEPTSPRQGRHSLSASERS